MVNMYHMSVFLFLVGVALVSCRGRGTVSTVLQFHTTGTSGCPVSGTRHSPRKISRYREGTYIFPQCSITKLHVIKVTSSILIIAVVIVKETNGFHIPNSVSVLYRYADQINDPYSQMQIGRRRGQS
jgi:hypothetical protein